MSFKLGKISDLATPLTVTLFFVQFLLILGYLGYEYYNDSSESCINCHGSKEKMIEFGYPQFYVTLEEVRQTTGHKTVQCRDCHFGNGRAFDKDKAHEGILKAIFVNENAEPTERTKVYTREDRDLNVIKPTGENALFELLPKRKEKGKLELHSEVRNILWHDRNPQTFNFDPKIAEKTCGKRGCHSEELKQFKVTTMATNFRQRTMRSWLEPYGPHNCGPSFADLPPMEILKSAGFDFENTEKIRKEMNIPFTNEQAIAKQRLCNVCHAGCLDCHYAPTREKGAHAFIKIPDSLSCMGRGRGNSVCHTGSGHSRRGETYIGKFYSIPQGRKPDIHFTKGIHCVECHPTGKKGMGDMQRKATCGDCHLEIEKAHANSIHKALTCTACHVTEAGGYQITVWGKGYIGERANPFKKYSLYYGMQSPLILIKDQKGVWFPVKIFPHLLGNVKKDVSATGIKFRWQKGETRDMYAVIGTFDGLPSANKHLLWLQIEEVSHPFGKARDCKSCHKKEQVSISKWKYEDTQGSEPFEGGYRIVADEKGLRLDKFWHTKIIPFQGYEISDFASWIFLKDKWFVEGNFAIKVNPEKYKKYERSYKQNLNKLKELARDKNLSPTKLKTLRGILLHNPDEKIIIN
ncbi:MULTISPECIES: cytochrome c3 family protein [Thermodesulfovibrio]|jgi:hypothetical protein|uniref:cytochrome c3 family protein n=1 Tax=Thermodesulfovibrio TaxID=28261 RepID=UPI002624DE97|nr:cytochrome c3 family protein [Thermodesulfovibrio sp.]